MGVTVNHWLVEFDSLVRSQKQKNCPGDGIGIRTGLRNQVLRVRISPRAPSFFILALI